MQLTAVLHGKGREDVVENAQDVQARAVVCAVSAKTKYQMERVHSAAM